MGRKIRMGMVGGGRGAFIGAVHRMAATIDGQIDLVCGAFSSDPGRSKLSAADLYIPTERAYGSYEEMIQNLPGVDHQGEIVLVSQGDLVGEHGSLRGPGRVVVVVVETALPHCDDALVGQERLESGDAAVGVVGMNSRCGPHLGEPLCHGDRSLGARHIGADVDESQDTRRSKLAP